MGTRCETGLRESTASSWIASRSELDGNSLNDELEGKMCCAGSDLLGIIIATYAVG